MKFESINPFDGKTIGIHQSLSKEETQNKIQKAQDAFLAWRKAPINERASLMKNAGQILRENVDEYADMITQEMGKPIRESRGEVNKCAWVCEYYSENGPGFLENEIIQTDASQSFVRHDPLGIVLAIMPWNFPFWQVFRFAAPNLTAGNVGLLKHAPNVFGCAMQIEDIFRKAGFPEGVFQSLIVHHDQSESIISNKHVKAVTLTGSERAGSAVAELAGRYIKKSVLELGGNNAFIVLEDADLEEVIKTAVTARMLNSGQSCIAAKRFILVDEIYDEFSSRFIEAVSGLRSGDPMDVKTQIGPLARKDLADQLHRQMKDSVKAGAKVLLGGEQTGCYHEPTILSNVEPGMAAFDEETFGPLAALVRANNADHAIELANQSRYGLGVTICTSDVNRALSFTSRVDDGAYFVNELVKSDPRLPFGGTGRSGFGRELARDGMLEFVNKKTVYVK